MRIHSIDIAKGIGIILVILGHLIKNYNNILFGGIHDWIYSFHMPLFFILSGMTFSHKRRIPDLAIRLLLPYIIWSSMATFYELITNPQIWKSILFVNSINTITTYGIAPFWFLGALFFADFAMIKIHIIQK